MGSSGIAGFAPRHRGRRRGTRRYEVRPLARRVGVRRAIFVAAAVLVGINGATSSVVSAGSGRDERWALQPPVSAPVADPFRLEQGQYGPGNRGLEYATGEGDTVAAAGVGRVAFVGPVAGTVYVSIDHHGGLRTAYGPVDEVRVAVGDLVEGGQIIATTVGPVHFSTRLDGVYVDPATLFGVPRIRVHLVPHQLDLEASYAQAEALGERLALYDLQQRGPEGSSRAWPLVVRMARVVFHEFDPWVRSDRLSTTATVTSLMGANASWSVADQALDQLAEAAESLLFPPDCTSPAVAATVAAPTGRRVAIVVDGLGSSSDQSGIDDELDLHQLGYQPGDVARFSYRGGVVPPPTTDRAPHGPNPDWISGLAQQPYEPADTYESVTSHAQRFAKALDAVRAANPGTPVDVYGFSLGGVVARLGLLAADSEGGGLVVTIGAPHQGVPAATAARNLQSLAPIGLLAAAAPVDAARLVSSPVVRDLSESGWVSTVGDRSFPETTTALTVGGRADVVVPASLARVPGTDHVVVGGTFDRSAHANLPGHPDTQTAIRLALAGRPPLCTSMTDRVLDQLVPEVVAQTERVLAAGVAAAGRS